MPVFTSAACTVNESCPITLFPSATALCTPLTSKGGVNDLYFIPCDEEMSEANILDAAGWWAGLVAGDSPGFPRLGNMGRGLGSITKKSDKKERLSSCQVESIISTTWALKYELKTFDKSADKVTHEQIQALIDNAKNYQLIARMCDGDNTVLPIGPISLSDFNWTVPDNAEELQVILLELSWVELGLPKTYDVTGLSAVVPKA